MLAQNPRLWRYAGDLAHETALRLIKSAHGSVAFTESLERGLLEKRAELGYETAPGHEKMLIEEVILCWLQLRLLDQPPLQTRSGRLHSSRRCSRMSGTSAGPRRNTHSCAHVSHWRGCGRGPDTLERWNVRTCERSNVRTWERANVRTCQRANVPTCQRRRYIPGSSASRRRKMRAGRASLGETGLPAAAASQRGA
jgi:hypothetical protein